jgi:hypothetical protein
MNHDEFRAHLDEYLDAAPDSSERRAVDLHAQSCPDCARELASLRALHAETRQIPRTIAPPHDLWPAIEDRIRQQTGFAVGDRPVAARVDRLQRTRLGWGALAAAVVVAALVSVWLANRASDRGVSTPADVRAPHRLAVEGTPDLLLPAVVSALEVECRGAGRMLHASLRGWDSAGGSAVALSLQDGLRELDASIVETRAALAREPGNPALLRLLTQRYQQKLALLHGARELVKEA